MMALGPLVICTCARVNTFSAVNVQPMEKSDITQLRNRLNERINQLRQKRNAPGANTANPRSREDILAARNKKKEDRKKAIKAQKEKGGKAASEELIKFDDRKVQCGHAVLWSPVIHAVRVDSC